MRRLVGVIAVVLLVGGCGGSPRAEPTHTAPATPPTTTPTTPPTAAPTPSPGGPPQVGATLAKGLDTPWGIGFLPDGSALLNERDSGRVQHLVGGRTQEVGRVDLTSAEGESGLLGLAVSPSYAETGRVFLYVTTDTDNRVLRTTFRNGRLGTLTPVLTGIPKGFIHDGGRLVFGPDQMLYVSTGETGQKSLAQDPSSLGGKILRITEDGDPAPGNPRAGSPVWSLGHRNVEGLAFDDAGRLWASEFGENTWDELNLVVKGGNYGWPLVEGKAGRAGLVDPQVVWHPDVASPSGLAFADGHLWVATLRGERLWRVPVHDGTAGRPQDFFNGRYGRLRTVALAPDGHLWLSTSNRDGRGSPASSDDRVLQVAP